MDRGYIAKMMKNIDKISGKHDEINIQDNQEIQNEPQIALKAVKNQKIPMNLTQICTVLGRF